MTTRQTNVKCSHCGYEWGTRSMLQYVTCPNCRKGTKNTTVRRE